VKRTTLGRVAVPAAAVLTLALGGCGAANESAAGPSGAPGGGSGLTGTISGAGSSAQAAAIAAWKATFEQANPGVTVNYDPVGSGGGREQFLSGGVDFGGTDAHLTGDELKQSQERCAPGELVEVPIYLSPISVAYHLEGVDNLRLAPTTLAKIFSGEVTTWDDPAIAKHNPGADLPGTRITPVHRSDDSGTTENFTDYLAQAAPNAWPHEVAGTWPTGGGEAAKGTTGVVQAIRSGNGAIGYADHSQIGDLPSVRVKVGSEYVAASADSAARIVDASSRVDGRGRYDAALDLERTTTQAGTYPIVLASYQLYCTAYDDPQTTKVAKAWLGYISSAEGQQVAAEAAGSAPLSDSGRQLVTDAVAAMGAK
jgi:phosphate transport system substrate-binding protein